MNYLHAFHAGNFADVLKHSILCACLRYLNRKPAPYFILDSHAGAGRYDLGGDAGLRNPEYISGAGAFYGADPAGLHPILADYVTFLRKFNGDRALRLYPGSPIFIAEHMRESDRFLCAELNETEYFKLSARMTDYPRVTVNNVDGYKLLNASLPPAERRGLILIDPPFEKPEEFDLLEAALKKAVKKFATGVYLIWVPVKDEARYAAFLETARALCPKFGRFEAVLPREVGESPGKMRKTGLVAFNPPYILKDTPFTVEFSD